MILLVKQKNWYILLLGEEHSIKVDSHLEKIIFREQEYLQIWTHTTLFV